MGVKDILFSPNGRIGRKDFWIGWAIMFAGNIIAGIPIVGLIVAVGLIYVSVCVWGKRLHDMGKTAWLVLLPMLGPLVIVGIGFAMTGGDLDDAFSSGAFFGSLGLALILGIGLLVWVGATPGQDGSNAYGPDPRAPVATAAETFA